MKTNNVKPLGKEDIDTYSMILNEATYPGDSEFIDSVRLRSVLQAVVGEIEKSEAKQHPDGSSGAIVAYQECLAILDIYFGRVYPDLWSDKDGKEGG